MLGEDARSRADALKVVAYWRCRVSRLERSTFGARGDGDGGAEMTTIELEPEGGRT
jgi:hypothetical protein